ncbi:MAG TPA: winged helix-turn-helix domain-containing protein, partial [Candidatus Limnocylindrales bacterium]|nr:winged helix-turn-helix domain-containing protein [Candidatus Limnocylindrales bacterium]
MSERATSDEAVRDLEIRLFGPMRVLVGGQEVDPGARRQRGVLAILALAAGEVVSVDHIIDRLWGEHAPAAAKNTIQVYIGGL